MARIRSRNLTDYGVPEEEQKKLRAYCRNHPEERSEIRKIIKESMDDAITESIIESLFGGVGYNELIRKGRYIPINDTDFYAYRIAALAAIYKMLVLERRWDFE